MQIRQQKFASQFNGLALHSTLQHVSMAVLGKFTRTRVAGTRIVDGDTAVPFQFWFSKHLGFDFNF